MKALVTGGGGFLGRHIVRKLLARGDEVSVFGRSDYPDLRSLGVKIFTADIANASAVNAACKGQDAVFHTAALASIWARPSDFYDTNVTGTKNVIDACRNNGVKRLIYTSSPSVVYDGKEQLDTNESVPYPARYLALYPETKAEAERAVIKANGIDGLLTVSLRPHLIWGVGDTNLIPRLIERSKAGKLKIVGDGKNIIDTVYVENAADAHLLAVDRLEDGSPVPGSCYFITNGETVNCWDWINELLSILNAPPVKKSVPFRTAYAVGAILESIHRLFGIYQEPRMTRFLACQLATSHTYNIDKARKELGYAPAISIKEGMAKIASVSV